MSKNFLRFEMHTHTSESSPCGEITAKTLVETYHKLGYDGLIITDHFRPKFFDQYGHLPWVEQMAIYREGGRQAAYWGEKLGLKIFWGLEIRFSDVAAGDSRVNDYLVYGITEEELLAMPKLAHQTLRGFSALARKMGWLFLQAHPCRSPYSNEDEGCHIVDPTLLDGIEVLNAHPVHLSNNEKAAQEKARNPQWLTVMGSDAHFVAGCGLAHMDYQAPVNSITDIVKQIRAQRQE